MNRLRALLDPRLSSLLVILVGAVAALALAVDAALWARSEQNVLADMEFGTRQLETRAAALAARQEKAVSEAAPIGQILLQGATPGLVVAEMQRILAFNAQLAGATVRAVDTPRGNLISDNSDAAAADGLDRVRLTAEVEVNEQLLPDFLHAIETDRTVLIVDGFSLRGQRSVSDSAITPFEIPERLLTLRLDLSSFRLEETQ